jgi:hypothetical protein
MLFQGKGWLCTATIGQALAHHAADRRSGFTSDARATTLFPSESDALKVEGLVVPELQTAAFSCQPR